MCNGCVMVFVIIALFCISPLAAPLHVSSMDSFCTGNAVLPAEIYWALTFVEKHYSSRVQRILAHYLQRCF